VAEHHFVARDAAGPRLPAVSPGILRPENHADVSPGRLPDSFRVLIGGIIVEPERAASFDGKRMIAFIVRAVPSTGKPALSEANTTMPYFGRSASTSGGYCVFRPR
jgi:hypothetical protein